LHALKIGLIVALLVVGIAESFTEKAALHEIKKRDARNDCSHHLGYVCAGKVFP